MNLRPRLACSFILGLDAKIEKLTKSELKSREDRLMIFFYNPNNFIVIIKNLK